MHEDTQTNEAIPDLLSGLKARRDYLRVAASGRRWITKGFILQYRPPSDTAPAARVGLTVSKKVGKAVVRNRAKRRLRDIVRRHMGPLVEGGADYVLVARAGCEAIAFQQLAKDLGWALKKLHAGADLKPKSGTRKK